MGYFQVRYNSRVVIYERKMFKRLATHLNTTLVRGMVKWLREGTHDWKFRVQIPTPNTRWIIKTFICCIKWSCCLKRPQSKNKKAWYIHFKRMIKLISCSKTERENEG